MLIIYIFVSDKLTRGKVLPVLKRVKRSTFDAEGPTQRAGINNANKQIKTVASAPATPHKKMQMRFTSNQQFTNMESATENFPGAQHSDFASTSAAGEVMRVMDSSTRSNSVFMIQALVSPDGLMLHVDDDLVICYQCKPIIGCVGLIYL